jgi:spermidine synthase
MPKTPGLEVRPDESAPVAVVATLFFVSGIPALLYQIVWQRALFTIYGVNIESVTVVVAAFMLGLGIGSLTGGWLSERCKVPILWVFAAIELAIAVYGIGSLPLFRWVGGFTSQVSNLQLGLVAFLLVLVPTVLMGATLPLLTHYLVGLLGNVGRSVGLLYFVNTVGSAFACLAAVKFTMPVLMMSGTVQTAAAVNVIVGVGALLFGWRFRPVRSKLAEEPQLPAFSPRQPMLAPGLGAALAAIAGFISLSYEIVWYRMYSFSEGTDAKTFPFLLCFYLLGIALGSIFSRRLCDASNTPARRTSILWLLLFLASIAAFIVAPVLMHGAALGRARWTLPFLVLPAALLGAIFPFVCHLSVPPDRRAGQLVSVLYGANIAGSTAGTFLTGFLLMDRLPLVLVLVVLSILGLTAALAVLVVGSISWSRSLQRIVLTLAAIAAFWILGPALLDRFYERLQLDRTGIAADERFHDVVETRSGVITVSNGGIVYGGGVYDGAFNVDLKNDVNGIVRPYALRALHPAPRRVLEIGVSTGSWAQVIVHDPQVEHLTSIEINPGYFQLIRRRPEVASLMRNSKVTFHIDDGRRWLVRNPDAKFDFIVMNTIHSWRSGASNVLSVEFLKLVRLHLAPGGVAFYNPTGSEEVIQTGLSVFPHALTVQGFLAVSDSPLSFDRERWRHSLADYRIDGRPVFDLSNPEQRGLLERIVKETPVEDRASLRQRTAGRLVITDDNMGVEFR